MRQDEEFCQKSFDVYLKSKIAPRNITWMEGNQEIAPDYYLTIEAERFAVEITTLDEKVEKDGKKVPIKAIYDSCRRFVKNVEEEAVRKGVLTGTYYMAFPLIHIDFYRVQKALKNTVLEFFADTQLVPKTGPKEIKVEDGYCSIYKTTNSGVNFKLAIYPTSAKWVSAEEPCAYLEEILNNKSKKLARLNDSKILVILFDFPYVDSSILQQCVLTTSLISNFHTIFIVSTRNEPSYILRTRNPNWL